MLQLSPQEITELRTASHAALARTDFAAYQEFIYRNYTVPRHARRLCELLEAVERGDIKRLAIIEPPRHLKSHNASGTFPSWFVAKDPRRCVMLTSHAAFLAEIFSQQNRDTIASNPYFPVVFPDIVIDPNNRGKERWAIQGARESCIAAGVGGGIVGLGADLLVIDDPIKDYVQATSDTYQETLYNWYITTAHTRLTPDGRIIVILTRWAEGDFMDRVLSSEEGKDFTVLHLPALSYGMPEDYEQDYPDPFKRAQVIESLPKTAFPDPLGRPKDEPLWPERWSKTWLLNKRMVMRHTFDAEYQGNPSAPEGAEFKRDWFKGITTPILAALAPEVVSRIGSYDLAWSEKQRADWAVRLRATLYKYKPPEKIEDEVVSAYLRDVHIPPVMVVIEDVRRWKKDWPATGDELVEVAVADTNKYEMLVETVAIQNVAFRNIQKDIRLWRHIFHSHRPEGDKEVQARNALALGGRGCFFILYPNSAPPDWERDFLDELGKFPNAAHDDQVTTISQLVNYWQPTIDRLLNEKLVQEMVTPFTRKNLIPNIVGKLPFMFRIKQRGRPQVDQRSWFKGR